MSESDQFMSWITAHGPYRRLPARNRGTVGADSEEHESIDAHLRCYSGSRCNGRPLAALERSKWMGGLERKQDWQNRLTW